MKIKNYVFYLSLILALAGLVSMDLPALGPHGGVVKKAEGYCIEMKNNPDTVIFSYLLTKKMKTVSNRGISGVVKLFFSDSTSLDVPLNSMVGDVFKARVVPGFYACKITFHVFGNDISARFDKQDQLVKKK